MDALERRYDQPDRSSAGVMLAFAFGLVLLMILFPVTVIGTKWLSASPWYGVLFGILLMIAAILCHRGGAAHKALYACSFLLNGIGNGLSLSSLYVYEAMSTDGERNLPGLIPAAALLLIGMLVLLLVPQRKKAVVLALSLLFLLSFGFCIFQMLHSTVESGTLWRLAVFAMILAGSFLLIMVLLSGHPERSALCAASFAGFGVYLLITAIVTAVLSEGELLDGLDILDVFSGAGKKHKG